MFNPKKKENKVVSKGINVRNLGEDKKNIRKTRSDKKTDIKVPLTKEQRVLIRFKAKQAHMYPTNFCSYIVRKGLVRDIPFPEAKVDYPSGSSISFHVRLEDEYVMKLDQWAIRWDCSRKRAAYRILVGLIDLEGDGIYGQIF